MVYAFITALVLFVSVGQDVDTQSSNVSFEISNMGINTVEGTFTGLEGTVMLDPSDLDAAKIDVCLDAATVNTGNKKRDGHLMKDDWFDVEAYPTICFVSNEITKQATGYESIGKLTMHGVTKDVTIPLSLEGDMVNGTLTLNRKDYKVGEDTGKFTVAYDVEITISVKMTI